MEPTREQLESAARYLRQTRDGLIDSTSGLSAQDWNFKPAPDRWSVAEIIEHVVFVERRIHHIVGNLALDGTEAVADQARQDDFIMTEVPQRKTRLNAPSRAHPAGNCTGEQALHDFREGREKTIELLSSPYLRSRVFPHPFFGAWDGYQWLLGAAAHSARHTEQIAEVRAACATCS